MVRILSCERTHSLETALAFVKAGHDFFAPKEEIPGVHEFDRSALIQTIKDLKPDILLVGFRFIIDQEIVDLGIKLVATRTTGTDHITGKVEVIKLVGEELTDVRAVPELCLQKMLELLRRDGRELSGKTVGLIGYEGRISKILREFLEPITEDIWGIEKGTEAQDIKHFLNSCDVVSLNISSTEENRGFMDRSKFEMMKDGSYFLNSARPWLVDDEAFKWAMKNKLAGAWSDFPLGWTAENLIQTNHIGGKTLESSIKTEKIITEKLLKWLLK